MELFTKLKTLETLHKRMLAQQSYQELIETRKLLQDELGRAIRKNFMLSQKLFYEFENKSGHLLAQALHSKKAKTTVHKFHSPTGEIYREILI